MTTPTVPDYHTTWTTGHLTEPGYYRAECSCGWTSEWFEDQADAEDQCYDHHEVVLGPPDALDVLITELLDIQDDLAEAVIWLADHWTAELPAPSLSPRQHGEAGPHVVTLIVTCSSADQVHQVAALTGTPVAATGHVVTTSTMFGTRVRLEAFAAPDPGLSSPPIVPPEERGEDFGPFHLRDPLDAFDAAERYYFSLLEDDR